MDRITLLLELVEENPNDTFSIYALALEYKKKGQLLESKKIFENLKNNHPNYLASYFHFGALLVELELEREAIEIYDIGLELAIKSDDKHTHSEIKTARLNLLIEMDDL